MKLMTPLVALVLKPRLLSAHRSVNTTMTRNASPSNQSYHSSSSHKRAEHNDFPEHRRAKRAKYASAAWSVSRFPHSVLETDATSNECKRCKVKCIRIDEDPICQRCSSTGGQCVIAPSAAQAAKEVDKKTQAIKRDRYVSCPALSHQMLAHPACSTPESSLRVDIASLRQQVHELTSVVSTLVEKHTVLANSLEQRFSDPQTSSPSYTDSNTHRDGKPKQPQFVGPTRSAFSFNIAERSMANMGIQTDQHRSTDGRSMSSSPERTPEPPTRRSLPCVQPRPLSDALLSFSIEEVVKLVTVYQQEVATAQPILNTEELITNVPHILDMARYPATVRANSSKLSLKDINILRLAIATALTHESHGKNSVSDQLVEAVEEDAGRISSSTEVELKDLQLMGMLSVYFCHTGEELFAWRAIGRAARQALEMGLHRKQSLVSNFKDDVERNHAVQIFWVVYQLDRRWSFGTSLSFALNDKDIDPELPEPGREFPYLKCMITYGRLCSKVWEALPPYGSPSQYLPKEMEDYLEFTTQNWLQSIPEDLQFKHPRTEPMEQPSILQRLRTLLYLRGNYMRLLIHRHHVVSRENVMADYKTAQAVVDIAKDNIEVLVHFNETSDIYIRQPSVYHYYLLSALAILLLAVCHAPNEFSETSREPFTAAVELVRGFSTHGTTSRRLWKSIRGLLPALRSLSLRGEGNAQRGQTPANDKNLSLSHDGNFVHQQQPDQSDIATNAVDDAWAINAPAFEAGLANMPDMFEMGSDLLNLYDVFGSGTTVWQPFSSDVSGDNFAVQGLSAWEPDEVSRQFQGLI